MNKEKIDKVQPKRDGNKFGNNLGLIHKLNEGRVIGLLEEKELETAAIDSFSIEHPDISVVAIAVELTEIKREDKNKKSKKLG